MNLSETRIKAARAKEKRYELQDGDGLILEVMTSGKKFWRYRYTQNGRRSRTTIGEYPHVGLREARIKREEIRGLLQRGLPLKNENNSGTFSEIADEWLVKLRNRIKNEKEKNNTRRRLELHVFPFIGHMNISELTSMHILPVLQRLESRNAIATTKKVKQIISQIFRYAIAIGKTTNDPTYALKYAITSYKPGHFSSLTKPADVARLLRSIDAYPHTIVRYAMQFSALVFLRPGEVRHTEWAELEGSELHIPDKRMKEERPHIVPLAAQTIELLNKLRPLTGHGKYFFPSNRAPNGDRPMSENTVLVALRSIGYTKEEMTPHGFRHMASTLLNEHGFNRDWIELQLAHVPSGVRGVYNHAEYLPERRKMMQWWADYLDDLRTSATSP
jgi:integrase